MSKKKQEFDITGMHCAACVKRVENVVSKIDGVESVKVNLLTRKGSVEYKEGASVDPQQIIEAITNIGFGDGATHTTARKTPDEYKSNRDITFPLRHPEYVLPYEPFERHFYMSNNTLFDRIKRLFPFWFKNVVKKIVRG